MGRNGSTDLGYTERRRGGGVERDRSGGSGVAVAVAVAVSRQRNGHISLSRENWRKWEMAFFSDLVFVVDRKLEERKRVNVKLGKDGDYKKGQCSLVSLLTKDKATHPSLCPSSSHCPKNNIYNKITLLVLVLLGFPKTSLRMVSSVLNLNYVCF